MTFGHRLLRVYEMISGAKCSGNDVRYDAPSGLASDIAPCPKGATTGLTQRSKKLLDHLVRGRDKIEWKRKPKGAGSTEIDDEIELRGGVDGKIAGVGSAKDTIDVASS